MCFGVWSAIVTIAFATTAFVNARGLGSAGIAVCSTSLRSFAVEERRHAAILFVSEKYATKACHEVNIQAYDVFYQVDCRRQLVVSDATLFLKFMLQGGP